MKKAVSMLLLVLVTVLFVCCGKTNGDAKTVATVEKSENAVAITVEETDGNATLLDVMQDLQTAGKLTFTQDASGMVTSIENRTNAADWSACWMLYTSDDEMANTEWGTVDWKGESYGSSVIGASSLKVLAGETYVWSYQSF